MNRSLLWFKFGLQFLWLDFVESVSRRATTFFSFLANRISCVNGGGVAFLQAVRFPVVGHFVLYFIVVWCLWFF